MYEACTGWNRQAYVESVDKPRLVDVFTVYSDIQADR